MKFLRMRLIRWQLFLAIATVVAPVALAGPSLSVAPGSGAPVTSQAASRETIAEAASVEPNSPRAALARFFEATRAGHWQDAARFLVLDSNQVSRGAVLARRLKGVIDDHHWIDLDRVSGASSGRLDDNLGPDLEEVDRITVDGREESVRMTRVVDPQGSHWAFSPGTVARIDYWYSRLPDRWIRDAIIYTGTDKVLLRVGPLELFIWQWAVIPVLIFASWVLGTLLGKLTRAALCRIVTDSARVWTREVVDAIGTPITLGWALNLFWLGASYLVLTEPAHSSVRAFATSGMVFTLFWALWRSSGVIVRHLLLRPWATRSASARSLVLVGSNFARSAIFSLGGLAVLAAAGYPVGTLLTGLGIGGLAIAFGAQKTIENIFGSLSIVIDQPFRVGDLVHIDDFVGTVEDIGLRSTRFRTADRTLISIPNGKLAEQRLESYEARDRMRLASTFSLEYGTSRSQMQQVIEGFRRVLSEHPSIWSDAITVNFSALGESALQIEVTAWFKVPTWSDFQRCREEVLLRFMEIVEAAGANFAFPTHTVRLASGVIQAGPPTAFPVPMPKPAAP